MRTIQELAAQTDTDYRFLDVETGGGDNDVTIIDGEDSVQWVTEQGTLTASNERDRETDELVGYVYAWEPADEDRRDMMDGETTEAGMLAVIDNFAGQE